MTTIEETKQHDFDTSLDLFHLKDKIDVEAEHQKELQNMLEPHEMIKPRVSELKDVNL